MDPTPPNPTVRVGCSLARGTSVRHRPACRRTNHANIHVRDCKKEGPITTTFDMTGAEQSGPLPPRDGHRRPPARTGDKGVYLKQQLKDKLIGHKQYIDKHGENLPEIRNWTWGLAKAGIPAGKRPVRRG